MSVEVLDALRSTGYPLLTIALVWLFAKVLTRSSSGGSISLKTMAALAFVAGIGFAGYKLYNGDWLIPAGLPGASSPAAAFSFIRDASRVGGSPLSRASIPRLEHLLANEFAGAADGDHGNEMNGMRVQLVSVQGVRLLFAPVARYGSLRGQYYAGIQGDQVHLVFCVANAPDRATLEDAACREEVERIVGSSLTDDAALEAA